jgi:xanthine/CO dehydrogenase XdhC/CoxF family maturation factor
MGYIVKSAQQPPAIVMNDQLRYKGILGSKKSEAAAFRRLQADLRDDATVDEDDRV